MKKLTKILTVILLVAMVLTTFTTVVKAKNTDYSSQVDGLFQGGNVETGGITKCIRKSRIQENNDTIFSRSFNNIWSISYS